MVVNNVAPVFCGVLYFLFSLVYINLRQDALRPSVNNVFIKPDEQAPHEIRSNESTHKIAGRIRRHRDWLIRSKCVFKQKIIGLRRSICAFTRFRDRWCFEHINYVRETYLNRGHDVLTTTSVFLSSQRIALVFWYNVSPYLFVFLILYVYDI